MGPCAVEFLAEAVSLPHMDREEDADETLMVAYRDGDAAAFTALYERHRGPLYRYILCQCGPAAVAEELFQDVWMNLIRSRSKYRVEAKFATYLYRIAHNRIVDHHRARATRGRVLASDGNANGDPPEAVAPAGAQPEREVATGRRMARLRASIRALPDAQREAFLLREEGGLSVEEIARTVGVGAETAKSRLRYAVARIRRDLEEP